MSAKTVSLRPRSLSLDRLLWVGPLAGIAAAVANLVLFGLYRAAGIEFVMPLAGPGSAMGPLPAFMPAVISFIPALGAAALFGLLLRFSKRPVRVFVIVAALVLLLSFGGPLSLPVDVDTAAKLALASMHVVAGVTITGLLVRFGR